MQTTFSTKYRSFLDEIKRRILELKLEYDRRKGELELDYKAGVITEEQYEKYRKAGIVDFVSDRYSLSKEDIQFLMQYADIENGELMINFIKDEYEEKAQRIEKISGDICIASYYLSLPLSERKKEFGESCRKYYDEEIERVSSELDEIRKQCGDNYFMYPSYKELDEKLKELRKLRMSLDYLLPCLNDKELNERIYQFYNIDSNCVTWYLEKDCIYSLNEQDTYHRHKVETGCVDISVGSLLSLLKRKEDLDNKINLFRYDLNQLLEAGIKIYAYDVEKPKKRKLFGKNKISIEDYQLLFKNLLGFKTFIQFLKSYDDRDVVNVSDCFDKYVAATYSNGLPDYETFKLDLFLNVISFLEYHLSTFEREQGSLMVEIEDNKKELTHRSKRAYDEAEGMEAMFKLAHKDSHKTLAPMFTLEEEEELYQGVRTALQTSYNGKEEVKKLVMRGK